MLATLRAIGANLESSLAGTVTSDARRNMHVEMGVVLLYGAFYASVLNYTPAVLRRMGASADLLALYNSLLFLGSILTSFSVVLMRRRRSKSLLLICWFGGRGLFLLCVFVTKAPWLILLSTLFWTLEAFVIPAYTRIVQKLYPDAVRGRVMSTIRMVQVASILVVTPLAGWMLDHVGYRVLFPLGALMAVAAALLFTQVQVDEGPLPPRETKTFSELGEIVREDRRFVVYLISFALLGFGTMMSAPLYPIVQVDRLQLSYSEIGLLGLVESILWLASYLFWGRLLDRQGGVYILRLVCLISMAIPGAYIWATSGWLLLPAFIARGIVAAGFELGRINAGIQLANRGRIIEYAAIQSTTIGMRGIVAPLMGAALLRLGAPDTAVFALSVLLMAAGWLLFGFVDAPQPESQPSLERERLRARWPFRQRPPRP